MPIIDSGYNTVLILKRCPFCGGDSSELIKDKDRKLRGVSNSVTHGLWRRKCNYCGGGEVS